MLALTFSRDHWLVLAPAAPDAGEKHFTIHSSTVNNEKSTLSRSVNTHTRALLLVMDVTAVVGQPVYLSSVSVGRDFFLSVAYPYNTLLFLEQDWYVLIISQVKVLLLIQDYAQ